jgi:hypothetical protein
MSPVALPDPLPLLAIMFNIFSAAAAAEVAASAKIYILCKKACSPPSIAWLW